jgi:hypothetical protein
MNEETALKFITSQMILDSELATGWLMFAAELSTAKKMMGELINEVNFARYLLKFSMVLSATELPLRD